MRYNAIYLTDVVTLFRPTTAQHYEETVPAIVSSAVKTMGRTSVYRNSCNFAVIALSVVLAY